MTLYEAYAYTIRLLASRLTIFDVLAAYFAEAQDTEPLWGKTLLKMLDRDMASIAVSEIVSLPQAPDTEAREIFRAQEPSSRRLLMLSVLGACHFTAEVRDKIAALSMAYDEILLHNKQAKELP